MRIGLDLRMTGGGSGIDRYISELTHEILKQDKTNQYVLFFRDANKSAAYETYGHKIIIADTAHYSFGEQIRFPQILLKENLDIVHFPHFNVPILYRRPFIVTIHDLTHTLMPGKKKSRWYKRFAYSLVIWNAIHSAKKIIAVSNATKQAIINYYGINPEKIAMVYEGTNQAYRMIDKDMAFTQVSNSFGITKPYILYVGVWRRYKNLHMLAKAFDRLVDKGLGFQLVLAGEEDPFYPEIKNQVLGIKNHERIKTVGRVSDEDLNFLYNAATLFVLPSLIEGFGLTALEAANTGTPIAASDIPTLREVLGQGAEYFDPDNLENMIEVLFNLLQNPNRLEELANLALARSKHFSWKIAAEKTIQTYQSL
jgi:hypothetical protein